jgi:hypothetical protein
MYSMWEVANILLCEFVLYLIAFLVMPYSLQIKKKAMVAQIYMIKNRVTKSSVKTLNNKFFKTCYILTIIVQYLFIYFLVLKFELRALCLLGMCSGT